MKPIGGDTIRWPYSANLHCEILVDDTLVAQADDFIAPRVLPNRGPGLRGADLRGTGSGNRERDFRGPGRAATRRRATASRILIRYGRQPVVSAHVHARQ